MALWLDGPPRWLTIQRGSRRVPTARDAPTDMTALEKFHTEGAAALYLLRDATKILSAARVDFVVVGGWVPFLFHSRRYGHPGTFDLDVLLNPLSLENGSFDEAAESLLSRGYLRAVKNRFQAHRVLNVAGEDLVFHVDFLNEREPADALELVGGRGRLHSIYTPAMRAVFEYGEYRYHPEFSGLKFPSTLTFIATKAAAAMVKKRRRDAFDVFIAIMDENLSVFTPRWRELVTRDGLFRDANDALYGAVHEGDAIEKILSILDELNDESATKFAIPTEEDVHAAFGFLVDKTQHDALAG